MDAAMISRYMALVESCWMILPAFILEILDVILPTADTSVEVFPSGHAGSNVSVLTAVSTKPWDSVEDHLTTSVLVGRNAGMEGAPGEWIDS